MPVAVALCLSVVHPAAADPLQDARAHAAGLTQQLAALQVREEVVSQRYDAVEESLSQAVSSQIHDDRALSDTAAAASAAADQLAEQARSLYESGGSSSVVATVIAGGSPLQALDRASLAGSVLAYQAQQHARTLATLQAAAERERSATRAARTVTLLQSRAAAAAGTVRDLIASRRQALHATTTQVRVLVAADAAAAARADSAAATGLIADAAVDATPAAAVSAAIAAARSRLGDPYVWGATGPASFDCSGLTQWSYAHAGVTLPRTAAQQWSSGPHPSLSALQPGDLLFWATDVSSPATIHHVALYLGNGQMLAAPHTGENVQVQPVYASGLIGATRPTA